MWITRRPYPRVAVIPKRISVLPQKAQTEVSQETKTLQLSLRLVDENQEREGDPNGLCTKEERWR